MATNQTIALLEAILAALKAEQAPAIEKATPTIGGKAVQIDPIVGAGTEGTITLPTTGHVVSLPRPDLGEMFPGYAQRVSSQVGGDPQGVGALFLGAAASCPHTFVDGSPVHWPEMADEFFNRRAYMTDAEKAAFDKSAAEWAGLRESIGKQAATPGAAAQRHVVEKNKRDKKAADAAAAAAALLDPTGGTPVPIAGA